jgi:hypothetical protein
MSLSARDVWSQLVLFRAKREADFPTVRVVSGHDRKPYPGSGDIQPDSLGTVIAVLPLPPRGNRAAQRLETFWSNAEGL